MTKADLRRMVDAFPDNAVVAQGLKADAASTGQYEPVWHRAADLKVLLDRYDTEEPIWVEEQDQALYIVHLDDVQTVASDLTTWILVHSNAPLYEALRQAHHPR